jgi:hypothetical protein
MGVRVSLRDRNKGAAADAEEQVKMQRFGT